MNANRSSAFRFSLPLDRIGASTSLLCAIHCAALPFVVTLLPIVGLGFIASEAFEWGLVAAAVALATVSLAIGYRKHRSLRVLALASGAILLLIAGRLAEHHDWSISGAVLAVLGGVALAAGHYVNYRLCQSCQRCQGSCSAG